MKKFKYQKISKTKKLRYIDNYYKKKLYIVFLPGFMSDIEGQKPQTFKRYAIKKKLGFLLTFFCFVSQHSLSFVGSKIWVISHQLA